MTSREALDTFGVVDQHWFEHLRANAPELVGDLLGANMGMSPSDLAAMIRRMLPEQRVSLAGMAKHWCTPHAIDKGYFANCTALALPTLSSALTAIDEIAFYGCTLLIVAEWDADLLISVGSAAFAFCESLTLQTWRSPVLTTIRCGAFDGCVSLTLKEWHAPHLTDLWGSVFQDRKSLVLSTWRSPALATIGIRTFKGCVNLTLKEWQAPQLKYIDAEAFSGCSALVWETGCPFPLAPMIIEDGAFQGCTKLSERARSEIAKINPNAFDSV